MPKLEITNMVMVQDKITGKVIVQERIKSWCGVSFPGGHVENGESIYDSAVREIKEETGLTIENLKYCGIIYWFNNVTEDKYFVHLYKTTDYSGKMLEKTEEGRVFWTSVKELYNMNLSSNFREYLPVFLDDNYSEAFCSWNDDMNVDLTKLNP
ncbi:MAG: 8-oxo-dGTP diphosphatase, partial [Oscillospiraceae bacterium]|nr:8-oxo-dGTP diphosphatase [Oscillospiraceae bacterium]